MGAETFRSELSETTVAGLKTRLDALNAIAFSIPRGGGGGIPEGNDENAYVVISSNTTDGSVVFADTGEGGNGPYDITVGGNVHHEVDQKKFGTTSIYFDGTGDYLSLDDHADWDVLFAAADYTIDFWVYFVEAIGSIEDLVVRYVSGDKSFIIRRNASGELNLFASSNGADWSTIFNNVTSTETLSSNAWHHIAVVRDGEVLRAFLNGVALTLSSTSFVGTIWPSSIPIRIGIEDPDLNPQPLQGYMEEIRISNTARWTEGFTPPTTSFTVSAGFIYASMLIHLEVTLTGGTKTSVKFTFDYHLYDDTEDKMEDMIVQITAAITAIEGVSTYTTITAITGTVDYAFIT